MMEGPRLINASYVAGRRPRLFRLTDYSLTFSGGYEETRGRFLTGSSNEIARDLRASSASSLER